MQVVWKFVWLSIVVAFFRCGIFIILLTSVLCRTLSNAFLLLLQDGRWRWCYVLETYAHLERWRPIFSPTQQDWFSIRWQPSRSMHFCMPESGAAITFRFLLCRSVSAQLIRKAEIFNCCSGHIFFSHFCDFDIVARARFSRAQNVYFRKRNSFLCRQESVVDWVFLHNFNTQICAPCYKRFWIHKEPTSFNLVPSVEPSWTSLIVPLA